MLNKKGFTLIELIVVIIILGVLATIAIPQYLNMIEKGKVAKAKAHLIMLRTAQKLFAAEHNGTNIGAKTNVTLANACTASDEITCYIETVEILADADWDYALDGAGLATATKTGAPNAGTTLTLPIAGTYGGTHPLR